jgi:hypothetical protein
VRPSLIWTLLELLPRSVEEAPACCTELAAYLLASVVASTICLTVINLDSQRVELIGRSKLEAQLIRNGFEVARPHRDRGIDLIAYLDRAGRLSAAPIQMKASSGERFGPGASLGNNILAVPATVA